MGSSSTAVHIPYQVQTLTRQWQRGWAVSSSLGSFPIHTYFIRWPSASIGRGGCHAPQPDMNIYVCMCVYMYSHIKYFSPLFFPY